MSAETVSWPPDEIDGHKINAFDDQVGGVHYKQHEIQPFEYITRNNFNFYQGVMTKYIARLQYESIEKQLEDLDKMIHYTQMYKELMSL